MIVVAISLSDGDDVGNVLEKVRTGDEITILGKSKKYLPILIYQNITRFLCEVFQRVQ